MTKTDPASPTVAATPAISAARRAIPAHACESVWHADDGHEIRRIDWPRPDAARGAILFLCGRGDAYEKYLETLEHWHGDGWQVTAIDWRGQGGSGRLGSDEKTGHVEDFSIWINDLRFFWQQWAAETDGGAKVLIGHSMGGQLALRAVAEGAATPDRLVLVAPMLGFAGPPLPPWAWQAAAKGLALLGARDRPAWKTGEKPGSGGHARQVILTHDKTRYEDEIFWRGARPEIEMGAPSWGWVERACESMRITARADILARVTMPVLLLGASADRLVSAPAIRRAARLLPDARLLEFGAEAAHEILREADPVRDRALAEIDGFLSAATETKAAR